MNLLSNKIILESDTFWQNKPENQWIKDVLDNYKDRNRLYVKIFSLVCLVFVI